MKKIVDFFKNPLSFHEKSNKRIINALSFSDVGMIFFVLFLVLLSCLSIYLSAEREIYNSKLVFSYQRKESSEKILMNQNDLKIINSIETSQDWSEIISDLNPFNLKNAEAAWKKNSVVETKKLLIKSPLIRVGLFYTSRRHEITATDLYQVLNYDGSVLITNQGDTPVIIWFDKITKTYHVTSQNINDSSSKPYKIIGKNNSILKIVSYRNPPKWNRSLADNTFRGSLELRYATSTGRIWMINELPLEDYLKGLAETRANDNFEYLKVMTVVGRSYAYYHMNDNYKHANEYFNIDAYWDQVYRGFSNESRHPLLVKAVEDTTGEVVTYQNQVAVTPYFARSNGRTKNWSEVWHNNPYPYIKSVIVPQEQGFLQLGHGVGLSAIGAMVMAKEGALYKDIIDYFFQNIEITKVY